MSVILLSSVAAYHCIFLTLELQCKLIYAGSKMKICGYSISPPKIWAFIYMRNLTEV